MVPPSQACLDAIASAETVRGVPAGFLLAIARVESGRVEPRSGLVQPWPWTIDIGGKGAFYDTRTQAVDAVREKQAQGVASIDVGCMQVNLQQHPAAFASLDDAFDPVVNTRYAANFLAALHQESGDWTIAAGLYHSRTEELAGPYRLAVANRFAGAGGVASLGAVTQVAPVARPIDVMAAAWAATTMTDATAQAGGTGATRADGSLHLWSKLPTPGRRGARSKSTKPGLGQPRGDLRLSSR